MSLRWKIGLCLGLGLSLLLYNNCSGNFKALTTTGTESSQSPPATDGPGGSDPTNEPDPTGGSDPQPDETEKLSIVSFSTPNSKVDAGQKVSLKVEINREGPKLPDGKNVFIHFVKASNPNWFEFALYPVPGPLSSSWSGLVEFNGEIQIPTTASGVYTVQIGIHDPLSQSPSKNIKLEYSSPFEETFGSGEIGYRYVVSQIEVIPLESPAPSPGTESFLTFEQFRDDVAPQSILKSDYPLAAPAETYHDWYYGWRPGNGPNPPAGFSAQVGWYELFTNRSKPPGPHNWGVAVLRIIELEERNNKWIILRDTTDPKKLGIGMRIGSYTPQKSLPIETRTRNGRFEIKMPDEGGNFHGFPEQMSINGSGATNRLVLTKIGMVVWDENKPDDRAQAIRDGKAAVCHVGLDYWRYVGAPFKTDFSNNSDMGIGRSRVIGTIEAPSWHSHHTIPYSNAAALKSARDAVLALIKASN